MNTKRLTFVEYVAVTGHLVKVNLKVKKGHGT
jgi:hypothetical protein